jgi:hypothetical protein
MALLHMHGIYVKGNMVNISPTVAIDIFRTHGKIENIYISVYCSSKEIHIYIDLFKEFRDVFSWSYEEIIGIDSRIVEHEIKTYPNHKPIRQHLRVVNPRKAPAIKAEVKKLLNVSFIYPIPLIEWVSNPVPVDKKKEIVHVCMDFRDLRSGR